MCLAVTLGMVDGGVDLVKMIPMGHQEELEEGLNPPLPFYFSSFAFISLYVLLYLCFHFPSTLNTSTSPSQ